ncbi:hypothetical protein IWW52_002978 [Coemansia sp. RSA 2704]|nr:hypothetical protein IWW52_002978 [Coemansia sp. RSA 2704]
MDADNYWIRWFGDGLRGELYLPSDVTKFEIMSEISTTRSVVQKQLACTDIFVCHVISGSSQRASIGSEQLDELVEKYGGTNNSSIEIAAVFEHQPNDAYQPKRTFSSVD